MRRLAVFCLALIVAGCSRAPVSPSLLNVSLPDLARLDPSVQSQIQGKYADLTRTRASAGVPAVQLGAAFGELGIVLHAAEYYDAAEPAYRNAQTLMPSDPRWPYYLALLRRAKGDTAQSMTHLDRTLELRPNDLAALVWLGRAHLEQGHLERAEQLFTRAQSVAPKTVAVVVGLAQIALLRKDFTKAVRFLEEGLTIDPRADSLHAQLAAAYRGLGDNAQAEAHVKQWRNIEVQVPDPLREDLDLTLESGLSYDLRGTKAMAKADYLGAADLFRRGVALTPGSTQLGRSLRHKLGTVLFLAGQTKEAMQLFEEVVSLEPPSGQDESVAKAHYSLGVISASSGRRSEAIAHFTSAVAFSASYLEARIALGDALRAAGRPEAALPHYADAVRINPRAAEARLGYAIALVRLRRYAAATDWLVESVGVQPDHYELVNALARLLATAPDARVRNGQRALAMATDLFTSFKTPDVGETLAMALAEVGRFDEAIGIQRELLAAARRGNNQPAIERTTANLARYERREPCRTPWPDDDLIYHPVPGAGK